MILHSKYTDYKIIYKDKEVEKLEHITDSNETIEIWYFESCKLKEEHWYLNGKWHRKDGPAIIYYYESGQIEQEWWCLKGKYHRIDGPAITHYSESGRIQQEFLLLNDIEYTYDEFIQTPEYQAHLKQKSLTIFD